ncbi:ferroxidase fet3 [Blyttiomyces sp. JEL0837]|nr:ferroxidase fet3 [Blyttiomyces sp. JEL0837]
MHLTGYLTYSLLALLISYSRLIIAADNTTTSVTTGSTRIPNTLTLNWTIDYVHVNPDGNYTRVAIGINNKFPPDEVTITAGDTLIINVINNLSEPTSIHFHGLYQNGTNQYDGVSGATQCPIPPGSKFTYVVPVDQNQYGSYWIHGHNLGHYVDGLRTPLVIKNPKEERKYDEDITVRLTDWYHESHATLMNQFMSQYNPMGFEPTPDTVLINESRNSTISFTPGKVYRLRLICMSAIATFQVYLDNHNFTVIEVDGVDVEPYETSSVILASAQRYSVLVTALNGTDAEQNYLLHADMGTDMFDAPPSGDPYSSATIIYKPNAPTLEPPGYPTDSVDEMSLTPTTPLNSLSPTRQVYLGVSFQVMTDGSNHGTFNKIVYQRPKVPTLFTAVTIGEQYATNPEVYGYSTNPFVLGYLDVVEVVIDNFDAGDHPFHLHGHIFQVIEKNPDHSYDPANITQPTTNPLRRDTIVVPGGGYVILRFVADNPGIWFLHCHIEWHFQAGLISTFIEAPLNISKSSYPDAYFFEQCSVQGLSSTGNAAGNSGLDLGGYVGGPGIIEHGMTKVFWETIVGCALASFVGVASVVWYGWPEKEDAED